MKSILRKWFCYAEQAFGAEDVLLPDVLQVQRVKITQLGSAAIA